MARTKTKEPVAISLTFPRTGNPWIDAGIVGLYRILRGQPSFVLAAPGSDSVLPGSSEFPHVTAELQNSGMILEGPSQEVQACLEKAYDRLVSCYYDISSQKQREEIRSYNFYFDSAGECFHKFPKKRPAGAALLLFDKALRPAGDQEKWGTDPKTGKATAGRMPDRLAHLQAKLDLFLADNNLKPGPPAGLLIDDENRVRPVLEFKVGAKHGPTPCFLTGKVMSGSAEAKNTAFPLLGGSRSFVNDTKEKLHRLANGFRGKVRASSLIFLPTRR